MKRKTFVFIVLTMLLLTLGSCRHGLRQTLTNIASELGKMMFAPITMLGCMATATGCFTRDSFEKSLYEILPERKHNLIPINMEAFDRGAAFAK